MMNDIPKTFSDTRKAYGLSQAAFAKLIGCSRVSVSLYETGKAVPGSDKYAKVLALKESCPSNAGG